MTRHTSRAAALAASIFVFAGCNIGAATAQLAFANDRTLARWEASTHYIEIPFRVETAVLIPVQVNHSDALDFALDTGAPLMAVIGHALTTNLGVELGTQIPIGGSGTGETPMGHVVEQLTVSLRELSLLDQTAIWMQWDQVPFFDTPQEVFFDGIIGYDLLRRYVVELDFERGIMTLHQPDRYVYNGDGAIVPLEMIGRKPYMNAGVTLLNGTSTWVKLHVDLGANRTLSLIPSSKSEIVLPDSVISAEGSGLSGRSRSARGRIERLTLGAHDLDSVLTTFSLEGHATAGDRHGVLGLGVLRRFTVTFDYARDRMILEKSEHTRDPFLADMSGAGFVRYANTYVIKRVDEESPAATADLQVGDILRSIAGKPAASISRDELDSYLRAGNGVDLDICVNRDAELICTTVTLENRI